MRGNRARGGGIKGKIGLYKLNVEEIKQIVTLNGLRSDRISTGLHVLVESGVNSPNRLFHSLWKSRWKDAFSARKLWITLWILWIDPGIFPV